MYLAHAALFLARVALRLRLLLLRLLRLPGTLAAIANDCAVAAAAADRKRLRCCSCIIANVVAVAEGTGVEGT